MNFNLDYRWEWPDSRHGCLSVHEPGTKRVGVWLAPRALQKKEPFVPQPAFPIRLLTSLQLDIPTFVHLRYISDNQNSETNVMHILFKLYQLC
jgi:hypothetical protein